MLMNPNAFGALPPEINSGRMYAGIGSGPLLAAASAWDGLAAGLDLAASSYGSVLSELTSLTWLGPTSIAMVGAVTPYVAWLQTTASQAEQTGVQARAAAASYEAAFAMTVPPPVIAANRVRLLALIATNFFGQNTGAMAATEAEYAEFWAQDATAMYGYAEGSAAASTLSPFGPPPNSTSPDGLVEQAVAVSKAVAAESSWLPILPTNDWNTLVNTWGLSYFGIGIFQLGTLFTQQFVSEPVSATAEAGAAAAAAPNLARMVTATVSAGSAQAERIGLMSVPPSWISSASALSARPQGISYTVTPAAPASAPSSLIPGAPLINGGRPATFGRRRYGRRFRVMSRPPTGG